MPRNDYTRWELPLVDFNAFDDEPEDEGDEALAEPAPQPPTAEDFATWERESREQGYKEGYAAGFAKGDADGRAAAEAFVRDNLGKQMEAEIAALKSIAEALASPLASLDDEIESELMQLTVAIAQQLVRREIRIDPGEIIGVIRESLRLLPANARRVRVHLNPDDAQLVRNALPQAEQDGGWSISEDPLIGRGGCRLSTETSRIDATLEARLAALAATMLGGARGND